MCSTHVVYDKLVCNVNVVVLDGEWNKFHTSRELYSIASGIVFLTEKGARARLQGVLLTDKLHVQFLRSSLCTDSRW